MKDNLRWPRWAAPYWYQKSNQIVRRLIKFISILLLTPCCQNFDVIFKISIHFCIAKGWKGKKLCLSWKPLWKKYIAKLCIMFFAINSSSPRDRLYFTVTTIFTNVNSKYNSRIENLIFFNENYAHRRSLRQSFCTAETTTYFLSAFKSKCRPVHTE